MKVTEVISSVQSHLDANLNAPVQVSGADERPVPVVLIDDWQISHINRSNTNYFTSLYDDSGTETARIYRIPYDLRVTFRARHDGDVQASQLHDSLRDQLFDLTVDPTQVSDRISRVTMQGGGGVSHQFISPAETELTQAAEFTTSLVYEDQSLDNIETIEFDIEVTQSIN